jgi:hypothetical protein
VRAEKSRAGRFATEQVRAEQRSFAREHLRLIAAFFCGCCVLIALVALVVPRYARGFIVGVGLTNAVWMVWSFVASRTGAIPRLNGALAEVWTSDNLKTLRPAWSTIDGLTFGSPFDIDHVAWGPGGVFVLETKWSASPLVVT